MVWGAVIAKTVQRLQYGFALKIFGYYLLNTAIFLMYFNSCIKYNNIYSILMD